MQILDARRNPTHRRDGSNGGFPDPPAGEPAHVVRLPHARCGHQTRVRLPASLPSSVIRRVVCDGCGEPFEAAGEPPGTGSITVEKTPAPEARAASGGAGRRGRAGLAAGAAAFAGAAGGIARGARVRTAGLLAAARERLEPLTEAISTRMPERARGLSLSRPRISRDGEGSWGWISVPLAAAGVIIGLSLVQGDSGGGAATASAPVEDAPVREARLVSRPGFSLALPAGWRQTNAPDGATFRAESSDGMADATLWVEEDPDLGFRQFEQRSLAQLSELSPDARVVDRVEGPSIETTITELRAEPTTNGVAAPYRVTLRGAGPYRLYFATAEQPGANAKLRGDVELMHGSFRPNVTVKGLE